MVISIDKTVVCDVPVKDVFAFLADFTSTEQWDPGTVRTQLVSGNGGVGSVYENTSRFMGKDSNLTYVVEEYELDQKIVLRGENKSVSAVDTLTFTPNTQGGTSVRYQAVFRLKGAARFMQPLVMPAFTRLGTNGARHMEVTLNALRSVN